jgi:membrane protein YdbS with pleckstrin-like domain
MYNAFRQMCERVLRIPPEPEPPPGDESKTKVFLAAPNYYRYLLAVWALQTAGVFLTLGFVVVIPLVATVANDKSLGWWSVPLLVIEGIGVLVAFGSVIFSLAAVKLNFDKRWYLVTDRSLRVRSGVFQVREATVTFANIQHISISQGPIQRALGLKDLRVDTAGGGSGASHGEHGMTNMHTVWFRGVNNAEEIKALMQQRLRQLKDSGLGDHEEMILDRATPVSADVLAALREVHAEAKALSATTARKLAV